MIDERSDNGLHVLPGDCDVDRDDRRAAGNATFKIAQHALAPEPAQ